MEAIRQLIQRGHLERSLEELLRLNSDYNDTIIGIQGRLSALKNKEAMGIISYNDGNVELNGIRYSIVKLVSDIEKEMEEDKTNNIPVTDEIVFEKIINKNGLVRIDWLTTGAEKAKSVCKIHTSDGYVGTGFLIEGGYLYTNNHLINSASSAQFSKVEFGFDTLGERSVFYNLDHNDFITSKELDFTRVKVIDIDTDPLSKWGVLEIDTKIPKANDTLMIIQHPQGRSKEIAFDDSKNSTWGHRLHYNVTTEPGSSGSPVFDINWKVVALHHAGGNLKVNDKGDVKYVNEGILFKYIESHISESENRTSNESSNTASSTLQPSNKPIKTMFVYHSQDELYAQELKHQFFLPIRNGDLTIFDVQSDIPPNEDREKYITDKLEESEIVLVFISNNLYRKETSTIASQVEESVGKKIVIPIKVSPFKLNGTSFDRLMGLPRKQSIIEYENVNEVMFQIAEEVSKVMEN